MKESGDWEDPHIDVSVEKYGALGQACQFCMLPLSSTTDDVFVVDDWPMFVVKPKGKASVVLCRHCIKEVCRQVRFIEKNWESFRR